MGRLMDTDELDPVEFYVDEWLKTARIHDRAVRDRSLGRLLDTIEQEGLGERVARALSRQKS